MQATRHNSPEDFGPPRPICATGRRGGRWLTLAGFIAAILLSSELRAEVFYKSVNIKTAHVEYRVIVPKNYDPTRAYPGVLAFTGGQQTIDGIDNSIRRNWRDEAEHRGYIVVLPAAPGGQLFFQGGERIFPEFLDRILGDYKIAGNKFHIAGISNGGISALHIAALHPGYFISITAFPGFLPNVTEQRVIAIEPLCIFMHVGEHDDLGWTPQIQKQAEVFTKAALKIHFTIEKGQGHRLDTFAEKNAHRLFDQFEQASNGCPAAQ